MQYLFSSVHYLMQDGDIVNRIGYELADLTMHPPPRKKMLRVGSFFLWVSSVLEKIPSKKSLYFSEILD